MRTLTTREFDQLLAAFDYMLGQAIENPPPYFDVESLEELRQAVEEVRLSAMENEAEAQTGLPNQDSDSAFDAWINLTGLRPVSDK